MFRFIASIPITLAVLDPPNPELLAQGLIKSSEAPASPALSSFPAKALIEQIIAAANDIYLLFIILF
jgi:hypothetical protein